MALCCHGNFLYKLGRPPSKLAQLQQKWSSTTFLLLSNRLMMVSKVNSVIWGSAATPADLNFSLKYSSLSTIWTQEKYLKVAEVHVAVQRLYTSLHTSLNLTAWIIFTGIVSRTAFVCQRLYRYCHDFFKINFRAPLGHWSQHHSYDLISGCNAKLKGHRRRLI